MSGMSDIIQGKRRQLGQAIFLIAVIWFAVAFMIYPLWGVLVQTFYVNGQFSWRAFGKIMTSQRALKSIENSFVLAVVLTFTVNFVGTFLVLITEYFDLKGAKILRLGYISTLAFSGLLIANGWINLYGQEGVITTYLARLFPSLNRGWFVGFPAVLLVMTFSFTSNHLIFLSSAIREVDNNTIDAAKNLGAGQWKILRQVVLPTLKPVFLTLIVMTFAIGLGAFSAPLMVGGKEFQTIAPMILTFSGRPASRDIAALLSVILGISQMILLFSLTLNERKGNYLSTAKTKTRLVKQKINNPYLKVFTNVIAWILFAIYTMPMFFVVLFSFQDTKAIAEQKFSFAHFTLAHYIKILSDVKGYVPLLRSICYAGIAAVASVLFMLLLVRWIMRQKQNAFAQTIEYIYYIPWLVPTIMIALGYILAYDHSSPLLLGQMVVGQQWIVPVAYLVILLPKTLRYLKSAYYSFDHNLEDASRNLGASSFRTFRRIILPALMPVVLALIALNFTLNLAEYNMSTFLYQPNQETIGILIRSNSDPAATVDARAINLVYSVILVVFNVIILYLVYGRGSKKQLQKGGVTEL